MGIRFLCFAMILFSATGAVAAQPKTQAKAAPKKPAHFAADMRAFAATAKTKPIATKENREAARTFLNANPKWCGTLKATRYTRQAMAKLGVKDEISFDFLLSCL